MAYRGSEVLYRHYFGVTMSNLPSPPSVRDQPRLAVSRADEAIEALSETSSRIELGSGIYGKRVCIDPPGLNDEANKAIEEAVTADEVEADLERAELADSFLDPETAWRGLEALGEIRKSNYDASIGFL